VANLLGGSIQLGHRLGECNFDLLKKTYREGDGLVLKADQPIHPIDRCYRDGCALGTAETKLDGHDWHYVLSLPSAVYTCGVNTGEVGESSERYAIYNWDTGVVQVKDNTA
jgi:hypothetical protein